KLEAGRRIDDAARGPALAVPPSRAAAAAFEHHRVLARGSFVARGTLFLDNKVNRGVAGYDILTPLKLEGTSLHALVNRGWLTAVERSSLHAVATPEGLQSIEGVAVVPGSRFLELAPEQNSGPVRQNLVLSREEENLGIALQPFVIEQT